MGVRGFARNVLTELADPFGVRRNEIRRARADVAGAVANVYREVQHTGTEADVAVAARCYKAAIRAAGLTVDITQLSNKERDGPARDRPAE